MTTSSTASSMISDMPVWIDDNHMDAAWLMPKIQPSQLTSSSPSLSSGSIPVQDVSNKGRQGSVTRHGGTLLLTLTDEQSATPRQLVMKQITTESNAALSRQLGLAREALFYRDLAPFLQQQQQTESNDDDNSSSRFLLPRIYYAYGNPATGEKCIIMESLSSWIDSGILFGPTNTFISNPNNWSRDIPALLAAAYPNGKDRIPTPAAVAKESFCAMARIHAKFWCSRDVLLDDSKAWLRGHAWLQGQGKDSWQASQSLIQNIWKDFCSATTATTSEKVTIQWDPLVKQTVQACVSGISWEAQTARLHVQGRWTLVHGDCWPGNIMWNPQVNPEANQNDVLRLIDWEMVGLGSGPQDLGQYMLSNMNPVDRKACERELIQAYYEELKRCGVPDHDKNDDTSLWEYCWQEYRIGGVERWLWFLVWFLGQPNLTDWAQFFHDQIAAFMHDHSLTAADLTQPRP